MSYSTNASSMASDKDELFLKRRLQFADNLKDLKNLKKQLYSAAACLESSYNQDYHKQFVVESSRDYVGRALVSTVDHLGSVADKLEKFLDEKAHEFSATIFQFSLVEQRLSTLQDFIYMNGLSQHSFKMEESTLSQPKHLIFPAEETFATAKPKVLYRNSVSTIPYDVQSTRQGSPSSKAFQATKMKLDSPALRKKESRRPSREPSPIARGLSFSRITPSKEAGMRSVSPLGFPFHLSGSSNKTSDSPTPSNRDSPHRFPFTLSRSFNKRSVSPTPSTSKGRWVSEPRRAVSAYRARPDRMMANSREKEVEESYTKRSKHLFKALLSFPHSRK